MLVGLVGTMTVLVTDAIIVVSADAKGVLVETGNGVPVTKDAPGVRKTFSQLG